MSLIKKTLTAGNVSRYTKIGWQALDDTRVEREMVDGRHQLIEVSGFTTGASIALMPCKIVMPVRDSLGHRFLASVENDWQAHERFRGRTSGLLALIESMLPLYQSYRSHSMCLNIEGKRLPMHIWGVFDSDLEFDQYERRLVAIRHGGASEHPYCQLHFAMNEYGTDYMSTHQDLWVDVDRGVVMSYDQHYMARITSRMIDQFRADVVRKDGYIPREREAT